MGQIDRRLEIFMPIQRAWKKCWKYVNWWKKKKQQDFSRWESTVEYDENEEKDLIIQDLLWEKIEWLWSIASRSLFLPSLSAIVRFSMTEVKSRKVTYPVESKAIAGAHGLVAGNWLKWYGAREETSPGRFDTRW